MNTYKIIVFFIKIISLLFLFSFLSLLVFIFFNFDNHQDKRKLENHLKNLQQLPYLQDTQNRLYNIGTQLHSTNIDMGSLKYSSSKHWIYTGATIKLNQCIDFYKLKQIIISNGFQYKHQLGTMYLRENVTLHFIKASRYQQYYEKELLCDILHFNYSWYVH